MEKFIIKEGGQGEIVEKKSRFIATILPIDTEEEALQYIEKIKKKYWDARHNCFAFVIGSNNEIQRFSDDGEPQGTAGQPMLAVFDRENVQNVVCVVTRYFGGILLGAGGLTRAYTKTAKMALDAAGIARRCVWDCVDISCSYAFLEWARLELAAQSGEELNAEYGAAVLLHACLPHRSEEGERMKQELTGQLIEYEQCRRMAARLRELSAGTVTPVKTGNIYRAERVEK